MIPTDQVDNAPLIELILPWAKANEPDAYAKTLAVATRPLTFRRYLVRLVEIRCEKEKAFRRDVPLSILEETSLKMKLRGKTSGVEIEVAGERYQATRRWSFKELAMLYADNATAADFENLNKLKVGLDLELVNAKTN